MKSVVFGAVVAIGCAMTGARAQSPVAAKPVEPIDAIVGAAFTSHTLVALGDVHSNEQDHAFRALLRDRRSQAVVNDIVVEFGTARYQNVIDGPTGRAADDVMPFAAFVGVTAAVMLGAGLLARVEPERRALRINPIDALRDA